MFFTEMAQLSRQLSEANNSMTRGLMQRGLDAVHKANPFLFNERWIGGLKRAVDNTSSAAEQKSGVVQRLSPPVSLHGLEKRRFQPGPRHHAR